MMPAVSTRISKCYFAVFEKQVKCCFGCLVYKENMSSTSFMQKFKGMRHFQEKCICDI